MIIIDIKTRNKIVIFPEYYCLYKMSGGKDGGEERNLGDEGQNGKNR